MEAGDELPQKPLECAARQGETVVEDPNIIAIAIVEEKDEDIGQPFGPFEGVGEAEDADADDGDEDVDKGLG